MELQLHNINDNSNHFDSIIAAYLMCPFQYLDHLPKTSNSENHHYVYINDDNYSYMKTK